MDITTANLAILDENTQEAMDLLLQSIGALAVLGNKVPFGVAAGSHLKNAIGQINLARSVLAPVFPVIQDDDEFVTGYP